ncbi:hypothetical protein BZL30_0891 [Mycobacterium kansasii]|uniref:Uncharacterized protein n=1 Tax=Mycobacterium kansasii TaxID=1768 RepID=A0A1V3XT58_MYCKA|nr:hypothetical protein BZL30_0891 [Mycobacterium kansasii]
MGLQIDQEVVAELALLSTGGTASEPPRWAMWRPGGSTANAPSTS